MSVLKVDGYLARRYKMQSVVGTILDPAADKLLMTTLTVTLAMKDLIPGASAPFIADSAHLHLAPH